MSEGTVKKGRKLAVLNDDACSRLIAACSAERMTWNMLL